MSDWNSLQYVKFKKERTQPSVDLIHRINLKPKTILDIGCGPGNSTNQLFERFKGSEILGVDSSDNMLEKAKETYPELSFCKLLIPDGLDEVENFDLIFSNACLHWIPEHDKLLPKLMTKLNDGGILAVQMPLVQEADFYKLLNVVVADDKWKKLRAIRNFHNLSPDDTYDILSKVSSDVTMWSTTYYHIVPSYESVIDWYKGSGLRPYLEMLDTEERKIFVNELMRLIESRYHKSADGNILLKMPRLFFTAVK